MPVTSINEGNPLNNAGGSSISNKSKFVYKVPIAGTYRFAEYGPCFCAETVPDDDWQSIHVGHNIISGNLKAPLLQDVMIKKDFFWVPDMAILPFNWEKFFVNPVKGEDVPIDVGCCVEGFSKKIGTFFTNWSSFIGGLDPTDLTDAQLIIEHSIKFMLCAEQFYTEGCLLSALEYNFSPLCTYNDNGEYKPFSAAFDAFWTNIQQGIGGTYRIKLSDGKTVTLTNADAITLRSFICQLRDDYSWEAVNNGSNPIALQNIIGFLQFDEDAEIDCNLRRIFAYQIACAHFFTNDKIDYVYSAELYRQLVYDSYYNTMKLINGNTVLTFEVNDLNYQYDFLSAAYFNEFISKVRIIELLYKGDYSAFLEYLRLIFGFNYSLRYADYFTGSRSQPLAVGDVNVAVNNNMVNVVNVAAKTMAAKMLNVANRVGQRIEAYVKEFFHIEMAKDYHNPFWLMHTTDSIGNPETQNTAEAQQSMANTITSIFRQSSASTGFGMKADRSGIIIGIQYFDIERVYPHHISRHYLHKDRFDDFLPYLQYIGDQDIKTVELDSDVDALRDPNDVFGYTGRNMEYKQMVPYCFGGFYRDLKPYIFLADEQRFKHAFMSWHIGPSFIRSLPTELDRFYNVLNGFSIDTYYHFAIVNNVNAVAVRPMAALPGILNG